MATHAFAGPIDYAAFVLPRGADADPILRSLLDRVDSGAIELLDLEVLAAGEGGVAERQPLQVLRHDGGFDLSEFEGAESGLLDEDDLRALGAELGPEELALVIVYEDRSLAPLAARVVEAGGRELWSGGVDPADLDPALTDTEGAQP